jgi:hypothetical protein
LSIPCIKLITRITSIINESETNKIGGTDWIYLALEREQQ